MWTFLGGQFLLLNIILKWNLLKFTCIFDKNKEQTISILFNISRFMFFFYSIHVYCNLKCSPYWLSPHLIWVLRGCPDYQHQEYWLENKLEYSSGGWMVANFYLGLCCRERERERLVYLIHSNRDIYIYIPGLAWSGSKFAGLRNKISSLHVPPRTPDQVPHCLQQVRVVPSTLSPAETSLTPTHSPVKASSPNCVSSFSFPKTLRKLEAVLFFYCKYYIIYKQLWSN